MATAIDNLGRKIDSSNMTLGEIKALIGTMMKSKVGAARPVESRKEAGEQDGNLSKIRELLEEYTKDFAKDAEEQKSLLSSVVSNLKSLLSQREEKKANKEENPNNKEKVSKEEITIAKATEGMHRAFTKKGSGYTHDIYVEAAIKNLLNAIQSNSKTETVMGAMPQAKQEKGLSEQSSTSDLQTILEKHVKEMAAVDKGYLESIVDRLGEILSSKKEAPQKSKSAKVISTREEKTIAKSTDRFAEEFHKTIGTKGSGWVHDPYCEKVLNQILATLTISSKRKLAADKAGEAGNQRIAILLADPKGSGGKGGGGGKSGAASPASPRPSEPKQEATEFGPTDAELRRLWFMQTIVNKVYSFSNKLQDNFLGFNGLNTIIKGISDEERKFTQEVRATAYEVAGVTKESRGLQKIYEQIGTSSVETGMDRSQTQKFYLKALKIGIKDSKTALAVTKAQLNTERQIGVEAGTLNETFLSMAKAGRMNNDQIAQMGRGMRDVARNTGMTGDALADAIKNSAQFTTNLRKAANLTASSVENIVEISVNAKKLGIENEMQPLLSAMTSTNDLFFKTSDKTRAMLLQAANSVGRMKDLKNGTILNSKEGIKDMAKGFDNILKKFGVESLNAVDNLSDEAKTKLNIQLSQTYGIELGDMRSVIETMQESGKGMADRLAAINKQKLMNLTIEEKAALQEKERAMKAGKSLSILTALSEATKGTGDGLEGMTQALSKFETKNKKNFEEDMKAMGQSWSSAGDAAKQSIESALKEINTGRKKAGMSEIKIDASEINAALQDKDALAVVMGRLTKGEQELASISKQQLDPMTNMEKHLEQINDNIRVFTQGMFSGIFNSILGQLIAIAGVLASILAGVAYMGLNVHSAYDSTKRLISDLTGWKRADKAAQVGEAMVSGRPNKTLSPGDEYIRSLKEAAKEKDAKAIEKSIARNGKKQAMKKPDPTAFDSIKNGWDDVTKSIQSKMKKMGKGLKAETYNWSVSIKEATENLAKQVEANPIKVYGKMITDFRAGTINTVAEISSKIKQGFDVAKNFTVTGMKNIGTGIKSGFQNAKKSIQAIKISKDALKGIEAGKVLAVGVKGIGNSLAAITKASGQAGGGLLKFAARMNPLALAVMAGFAAIDGLTGALEAGARAGEIFGKKQEDVTMNEEYAAKTAGLLTGVLNGLTLGIAGWILPMDKITDSIARFNAKVPILTVALAPLVIALELVWGVIKGLALGIWEIMKGLWNGVMNIINPVVEGLSDIFSTISGMFVGTSKNAGGLTKVFRELGGVVGIVSGTIKFVGTAIGWIFRAIGSVIGFIIKAQLKIFEGLTYVLQPIAEVFTALWGGIMDVGRGIGDVFMGIWDVVSMIGSQIYGMFSPIFSLFGSGKNEGIGFMDVLKGFGMLLGKTAGILLKVVIQPLMVLASLLSGIGKIIQAIVKVFKGDFSGAGELIKSAMMGVVDALLWPFKEILSIFGSIGKSIFNAVYSVFSFVVGIFSKIASAIVGVIGTVFSWIGSAASTLFGWISGGIKTVFGWISGAVGTVFGWIGKAASTVFGWIGSAAGTIQSAFGIVFGWLGDAVSAVGSAIGTAFGWIKSAFGTVINAISTVVKSIYDFVVNLEPVVEVFDALWDGLKEIGKGFYEIYAIFEEIVSGIFDTVTTIFGELFNIIGSLFGGGEIKNAASQVEGAISKVQPAISMMSQVMGYVTKVISFVAKFATIILKMVLQPLMILAKVLSGIGKLLQAVAKLIRGDFSGASKLVGEAIMGIVDAILWPFKEVLGYFLGFGKKAWSAITSPFSAVGSFGSWLFNSAIDSMGGFGLWLYENTIGAMAGFGNWLYENTIGAMAGFGNWLYDTFAGTMSKVMDYVLSLIPGSGAVKAGAQAFSATETENTKRVQKEGSSSVSGIGRTLGGIKELSLKKTLGGIGETGSAMLSNLNPFNWFEEGTRQVEQTGVGVLHKNEMVIPAKDVETLSAKGAGKFDGSSSFLSDVLNSMLGGMTSPTSMVSAPSSNPSTFENPSNKAIEMQLMTDQSKAQVMAATSLNQILVESMTGDGLFVQDKLGFVAQKEMIKLQMDSVKQPLEKVTNAANAKKIAEQGMMPSIGSPKMNSADVNASTTLNNLISQPTSASGMSTQGPISVEPISVAGTGVAGQPPTSIRTVAQTSPSIPDIHSAMASEKASTSPVKTEITSAELGAIATEAEDQNAKLDTLITLFTEVLAALKPKSTPISSSGGAAGDTASKKVVHRPSNSFRNTVGLVTQTAGKAALNLGPPKA